MQDITKADLYIALVTLVSTSYVMNAPNTLMETTPAALGYVYSFLCTFSLSCAMNAMILGIYALWSGAPIRLLNIHVMLYLTAGVILNILAVIGMENKKLDLHFVGQIKNINSGTITAAIIPVLIFQAVILPIYFLGQWGMWRQCSTCVNVVTVVDESPPPAAPPPKPVKAEKTVVATKTTVVAKVPAKPSEAV